ncbi:MAG: hypothetical protein COA93_11660 [Alphaproteobacteria bacterium]|nr:MAG: hypothetical protein COA93_11660 [Alphaproteobacteria bacterium]
MKKLLASLLITVVLALISITTLFLLRGWNGFEIKEIGENTFLLNKSRGEVLIIKDGAITNFPKYNILLEKNLQEVQILANQLLVEIRSKVVFNRVFFKFTLKSRNFKGDFGEVTLETMLAVSNLEDNTKNVKWKNMDWFKSSFRKNPKGNNSITLKYFDVDGYLMRSKEVQLSNFDFQSVGSDGKLTALHYEGSFPISPYQSNRVDSLSFVYTINALKNLKK